MNRRTFSQRLTWAAAAATVVPKVPPGPKTLGNDCVFVSFTLAPLHMVDDNWWAFRERINDLHRQDYDVRSFTLAAEQDGYRRVRVQTTSVWTGKNEAHEWSQPWSRDAHYRENIHWDFAACQDCSAVTKTPHAQHCKQSTVLAHKLGPELNGFKTETDLITAPTQDYKGPWKS
jgi:hypothetical protein